MDDISSGMDVEVSENRSGFIIKLHVAKGKDCPNKGDIMLLSSRESKSRDQILKDDGLCTIVVVKNTTLWYERSDNSKRGWMTVSLSKLPHGGNPSQEGLYQVMHLENLSTYECCWKVMTNGFKCSSKLINLILSKNNIGVSKVQEIAINRKINRNYALRVG